MSGSPSARSPLGTPTRSAMPRAAPRLGLAPSCETSCTAAAGEPPDPVSRRPGPATYQDRLTPPFVVRDVTRVGSHRAPQTGFAADLTYRQVWSGGWGRATGRSC